MAEDKEAISLSILAYLITKVSTHTIIIVLSVSLHYEIFVSIH